MPLFCRVDWPRRLRLYFTRKQNSPLANVNLTDANDVKETCNQTQESPKSDCSVLPSKKVLHNETVREGK